MCKGNYTDLKKKKKGKETSTGCLRETPQIKQNQKNKQKQNKNEEALEV